MDFFNKKFLHMFDVFRAGKSIFYFRSTFNLLQLILKSLITVLTAVLRENGRKGCNGDQDKHCQSKQSCCCFKATHMRFQKTVRQGQVNCRV